jgi:YD repeat-containing protein
MLYDPRPGGQQWQEVYLIMPDGGRFRYDRISPGTGWTDAVLEHVGSPTPFYKSRIVWNGSGWDVKLKDGTVFVFGDVAPLQSIRDRFGNEIRISRASVNQLGSPTGNMTRIVSQNGRWLEFTYDASNRITQARDNFGRTVNYLYDSQGRLIRVTNPAGGTTEYTYDRSNVDNRGCSRNRLPHKRV